MRGIFITGTDTGVGKTLVTAALLQLLRERGVDAVSMKPVQTGAAWLNGALAAPDLLLHLQAGNFSLRAEEVPLAAPYRYEPACSPHLAAGLAGHVLRTEHIRTCAMKLLEQRAFLLVEGAGGVLVPLNARETMRDLMAALGFPVVLVARAGLGTINHSLLSLEALRSAGLKVAGVVLNDLAPDTEAYIREDNLRYLQETCGVPCWSTLAYQDNAAAPGEGVLEALRPLAAQLAAACLGR